MEKSQLKQIIKEVIREEFLSEIPDQSQVLDNLYFSYSENGINGMEYRIEDIQGVDPKFAKNLKIFKNVSDRIVKYLELYSRKYQLNG